MQTLHPPIKRKGSRKLPGGKSKLPHQGIKIVPLSNLPSKNGKIRLKSIRQNNLKGFDLDIELGKWTVVTGLSGSGKSSLVFDTLYAEGQRRYVETFSPYARQFLERLDPPKVESIEGIPPAIAIQQGNTVKTSRSSVGTLTELCDYFKLLMPHCSDLVCPTCNRPVASDSAESISTRWYSEKHGPAIVCFPVHRPKNVKWAEITRVLLSQGYHRFWNGQEANELKAEKFSENQTTLLVVQDRLKHDGSQKSRLCEAIETAFRQGKGRVSLIDFDSKQEFKFSEGRHCAECDKSFPEPTPSLFSFNNPRGACPRCRGFGRTIEIDQSLVIPNPNLSIRQGVIKPWQSGISAESQDDLLGYCRRRKIDIDVPFNKLTAQQQKWVIEGDPRDPGQTTYGPWYGVDGYFRWLESKSYKMHVRVLLSRYRAYRMCPDCRGGRFQPETLNYRLRGKSLPQLYDMPIRELAEWVGAIQLDNKSTKRRDSQGPIELVLKEIQSRLELLNRVGLGYLTLNRTARTLSGGEVQRVSLTTCLGSSVVNTLFILDEPSVGLHARDIQNLISVLKSLRDRGNAVVVVEHDSEMIYAADHLVDLGPGSGENGGELILNTANVRESIAISEQSPEIPRSLTLAYLSGHKSIQIPVNRRKIDHNHPMLKIFGAKENNLKNLTAEFPLGRFVCVTGVSGSGKSTLVHQVLYENLKHLKLNQPLRSNLDELQGSEKIQEVLMVDQAPIGKSSRSNPAVYVGAWGAIRELFGSLTQATRKGFSSSDFSFNAGTGRCDRCAGSGVEKIEMQFLPDVLIECPICHGRRFKEELLQIYLQGKNILDVLGMTVSQSIRYLKNISMTPQEFVLTPAKCEKLRLEALHRLNLLEKVGLGYLRLGQSVTTLSGGEAQRLKLCGYLSEATDQKSIGRNLFIFDEPTTGLHLDDVRLLVDVLQSLVNEGHSVVVIEHHLDLIKCADWVIELGPEAGDLGGKIVFAGTVDQIIECDESHTGKFLKRVMLPQGNRCSLYEIAEPDYTVRAADQIKVFGARENNLKNINLTLPREKMVVVTGLSGSGKSTLAFDLIFSEGQRRFLDCMSTYARQYIEQMPRPDMDLIEGVPPTVAIEQRITRGGWKSTVATITEAYHFIRLLYAKLGVQKCPVCDLPVTSQTVSEAIAQIKKSVGSQPRQILIPMVRSRKGFHEEIFEWASKNGIKRLRIDGKFRAVSDLIGNRLDRYVEHTIDLDLGVFSKSDFDEKLIRKGLEWGHGSLLLIQPKSGLKQEFISTSRVCSGCHLSFEPLDPKDFSFNSPSGWCPHCKGYGVVWSGDQIDDLQGEEEMERDLQVESRKHEESEINTCPECEGARLKRSALHVDVSGLSLRELNRLSVKAADHWFSKIKFSKRDELIGRDIVIQVRERLKFMNEVGLDYLGLGRAAVTLSGGEAQRIRLASQLGSNLRGVLYVLDEPTIGLHCRDNERLLGVLKRLKERGNSLLVVEHDEDTMKCADWLVDLGPGAGKFGGEIVWQGNPRSPSGGAKSGDSRTLEFLNNPMRHPMREEGRRNLEKLQWIKIKNAKLHNLKNISLKLPVGRLIAVTGVSGAGKSSLIRGILLKSFQSKKRRSEARVEGTEHFGAAYEVDQSPIGKTPRSCPATYVGVWDEIRKHFASTDLARMRGYTASRFSFNTAEGRCENCEGQGRVKLKMNFLPDVYVPCEVCDGCRFSPQTLEVAFRNKTISQILSMSIEEAAAFFAFDRKIGFPLQLLNDTGLGYLTLGQSSPTLSGGEAQRMKLVTELMRGRSMMPDPRRGGALKKNLYILEEPSIGLHFSDIEKLIKVFHQLVDAGHTVIVVEHHMDIIAEADYVVDLGPEGGDKGGEVVAQGSPEDISSHRRSITGQFLKTVLERSSS